MNQIFRFALSFFSTLLAIGFFSSAALAEPTKALLYGNYSSSDYEVGRISVSESGFGFGGIFFPAQRVYLSYDQSEEIADFGGGLVLGRRLDHRAGIGFEHRIGLQSTKIEIGGADETILYANYNLGWGLGNGFSVDFSSRASIDDVGDDLSFAFGLNKSFDDYLFSLARDSHDFGSDVEVTSLVFSFGVIF